MRDRFRREIGSRQTRVVVAVDLGYVGLPVALSLSAKAFQVYGIDQDADRVRRLLPNETFNTDIQSCAIAISLAWGKFVIKHTRAIFDIKRVYEAVRSAKLKKQ